MNLVYPDAGAADDAYSTELREKETSEKKDDPVSGGELHECNEKENVLR